MKKFFVSFFVFMMVISQVFAADSVEQVKSYTQNLIDDAIVKIFNKNIKSNDERIPPFRKVLNDNFDFDYIANFVLGVYGRGLDASLKSNFVKEFAELNVYTFAQKFVAYSDQKIEVVSVNPGKKEGQFFVSSKVISSNPGDKDFIVDWRLEKEGDSYKVIDVIIEGVSMAMSYKNEYAPILKMASDEGKNPVEELILKIKDKIVQLKEQK